MMYMDGDRYRYMPRPPAYVAQKMREVYLSQPKEVRTSSNSNIYLPAEIEVTVKKLGSTPVELKQTEHAAPAVPEARTYTEQRPTYQASTFGREFQDGEIVSVLIGTSDLVRSSRMTDNSNVVQPRQGRQFLDDDTVEEERNTVEEQNVEDEVAPVDVAVEPVVVVEEQESVVPVAAVEPVAVVEEQEPIAPVAVEPIFAEPIVVVAEQEPIIPQVQREVVVIAEEPVQEEVVAANDAAPVVEEVESQVLIEPVAIVVQEPVVAIEPTVEPVIQAAPVAPVVIVEEEIVVEEVPVEQQNAELTVEEPRDARILVAEINSEDVAKMGEQVGEVELIVIPVFEEPIFQVAAEELVPVVEEAVPVVEEAVPVVEEAVPVVEEAVPVAEEVAPVVEEVAPVVEEVAPVVVEVAPVVEEVAPVVEEVSPVEEVVIEEVVTEGPSVVVDDEVVEATTSTFGVDNTEEEIEEEVTTQVPSILEPLVYYFR